MNTFHAQWISVKERLPKENFDYIVCIRNKKSDNTESPFISISFFSMLNMSFSDCASIEEINVDGRYEITHWMPLPDAPNDE
jgi:hypothetical protein